MTAHLLSRATRLSDQDLVAQVKLLAHREREATAVLIAHLAVLDERRLYLAEGCSSLFTYCTQMLHLSEHAAYGRIETARAARMFPIILERLAEGTVNLTTVGLLAPHLTAENHVALLDEARHKSKRLVEELVARLRPQPPVPSTIRRLPMPSEVWGTIVAAGDDTRAPDPSSAAVPSGVTRLPLPAERPADSGRAPSASPPTRRAIVAPLAPQQYRVQFTANAETHEKLRLAQDLLRHQIPDGDLGKIIDHALTLLLRGLAKQKHAATDRPRETERRQNGLTCKDENHNAAFRFRHIPAEVKRTVWARDQGQCAFVAPTGCRCVERGFLEFHHVVPYAVGGKATADNIQLRCRAHNGYEAELFFGHRMPAVRETATVSSSHHAFPKPPELPEVPL